MAVQEPSPAEVSGRLQRGGLFWLAGAAILVVAALGYSPLWGAEFSWDDAALVVDNRLTGDLSNWKAIFQVDLWSTTRLPAPPSGYYRPLFLLLLALERGVYGLSARWHHIHSLLWHLGTTAVLLALLRRLVPPLPALAGGAFFALHPVQSETVALIAARNDSMAAFSVLLVLYLLLPRQVGWRRAGVACLLAVGALLSKESAVLLPAFLLAMDVARWGRPRGGARYLSLLAAVAVYLLLRVWAAVGSAAWPEAGNWSLVAGYAPQLLGVYGSLIVWPWPLSPARHVHYLPPLGYTLPGLLMFLGLLVGAVLWGRRRRLVVAGLCWAVLAFGPTLFATLDKGLLGERYLYLPMAGLALALAAALPSHPRVWKVGVALAGAALLGLLLRLPEWRDSETLWRAAHRDAPTAFTAAGLGWYLNHNGKSAEALQLIVEAIEGEPPYLDACPLLVSIPLELNQAAETVRLGRWGLERGCPPTSLYLGPYALALAGSGRWQEAMAVAQRPELGAQGPGWVVLAAGMLRQGKPAMLQKLAARWRGQVSLVTQVTKLLRLAGDDALASRLVVVRSPPSAEGPAQTPAPQGGADQPGVSE